MNRIIHKMSERYYWALSKKKGPPMRRPHFKNHYSEWNAYRFMTLHSSSASVLPFLFFAGKVAVNHRKDPAGILASNPTSVVAGWRPSYSWVGTVDQVLIATADSLSQVKYICFPFCTNCTVFSSTIFTLAGGEQSPPKSPVHTRLKLAAENSSVLQIGIKQNVKNYFIFKK